MSLGPQCLRCKKRRVKCGSEEPQCMKCRKDGYDCPGYIKNPKWVEMLPRSRMKTGTGQAKTAAAPSTIANSNSNAAVDCPDPEAQLLVLREQSPKLNYIHPSLDKRLCMLKEAIIYFDTVINPDLSANIWQTRNKLTIREWAITPQLIQNMLIVSVLGTQVLKSGTDSTSLYRYRGQVIHDLSRYLRRPSEQSPAMTLALLVAILQQEAHLSPIDGYKVHLHAARRAVESCGGIKKCLGVLPDSFEIMTSFMQTDILSATTTHVNDLTLGRIRSHQGYIDAVPDLESLQLDSPCPCPLALFEIIVRINTLRLTVRSKPEDLHEWMDDSIKILEDLQAFNPWLWANNLTCLPQQNASSNHDIINAFNEWATLACCYQSATLIYLIESASSLTALHSTHPKKPADTLANKAYEQLQSDLKYLFATYPLMKATPENPTLWRFVTWPLMVFTCKAAFLRRAGRAQSLVLDQMDSTETIFDQLKRIGTVLGSYALMDGPVVFENVASGARPWRWDETFLKSCIFYL